MSHIEVSKHATTFVGKDATMLVHAIHLKHAINMQACHGIRMTNKFTMKQLMDGASRLTGHPYNARSRNDQLRAVGDLDVWINTMRAAMPVVQK